MSAEDLKYRLGTGPGGPNIEDGMAWAAANDFHFLDFNADHGPNALGTWDDERVRRVRSGTICTGHPTLSAGAEFSPYMSEADGVLRANIARCGWGSPCDHPCGLHRSLCTWKQASFEHLNCDRVPSNGASWCAST